MEDKLIQEGFAVISCNDFAQKLGLENLEEFTIFPKEIINGKTVITA